MNEFKQDLINEQFKYKTVVREDHQISISRIEHLFSLANLLRARYEMEMQRNATTEEYIEIITIASSFINK